MRKILFLAIIFILTITISLAQPRAVGVRVGWGIGASYQHDFGVKNMLQVDLDFFSFEAGLQATATYNWIFPFNSWKRAGSWNWYAGVGGGIGMLMPGWWEHIDPTKLKGAFTGLAGVAGMIGVEYNFKFPLQLSLDYRPLFSPLLFKGGAGFNMFGVFGGGFAVRYKF